jgi:hypothetical protein
MSGFSLNNPSITNRIFTVEKMEITSINRAYRGAQRIKEIASVFARHGFSEFIDRMELARRFSMTRTRARA